MIIIKCKMCGGDMQPVAGKTFGICEYCSSAVTLPKTTDESRINMYNRANHFRQQFDFDKAARAYKNILSEDNSDAEAHWGVVLSRYGIEYVEDPETRQRTPVCHRVWKESVLNDADYTAALKNSPDNYTRTLYEEEAVKISEKQQEILAVSNKEEQYDIFICCKETAEDGTRTKDGKIAQDIYEQLINDGYKVFYERANLADKSRQEYEPYVFNALNSAKIMLIIGTKKEHFTSIWVRNEWTRFLALIREEGMEKFLLPCYNDMDVYDLPDELANLQSYDMSKISFVLDLLRGIKKILGTSQPAKKPAQEISQFYEKPAQEVYEPAEKSVPVISEPAEKSVPVIDEPVEKSAPIINEPIEKSVPVINEPVEKSAPVINEPVEKSAPVIDEPAEKSAPITGEPTKKSVPIISGTAEKLASVISQANDKLASVIGEPAKKPAQTEAQAEPVNKKTSAAPKIDYVSQSEDYEKGLPPKAKTSETTEKPAREEPPVAAKPLEKPKQTTPQDKKRVAEFPCISTGFSHTVGLKTDGTVVAMGSNANGRCNTYTWRSCVAISAGYNHTTALRADGMVVTVGANESGQCNTSSWRDIVMVRAGYGNTIGLKADGTLVAVGYNSFGQCNVTSLRNIKTFSLGNGHTVCLKADGTVVSSGYNKHGQCDTKDWSDITAICAGDGITVGLKSDGTVVAAGKNDFGQCDTEDWKDIIAISAFDSHTVALKSDGTVVATGNNDSGQCDTKSLTDITAVYADKNHTVALRSDGTVAAVGNNDFGQCDTGDWQDVLAICVGFYHTVGLKTDGGVVAVGRDKYNECSTKDWENIGTASDEQHLIWKKEGPEEQKRLEELQKKRKLEAQRKREQKEEQQRLEEQQKSEEWVKQGLCRYCGGELTRFKKECMRCRRSNK